MSFLGGALKTFLSGAVIKALSKKTGLNSRDIKKFVPLAVPLLIKAMTNNASSVEGASSLLEALAQHNDDKPVDKQIADADIVDGAKIIGHILGSNQADDMKALSAQSKLSETAVSGILSSIAPALLTYLSGAIFGKASGGKKSGLASLVGRLLGGKKSSDSKKSGLASVLGALLGKGKSSDSKKSGFAKLLGGLFGKGKSSGKKDDGFDGASLISALLSLK